MNDERRVAGPPPVEALLARVQDVAGTLDGAGRAADAAALRAAVADFARDHGPWSERVIELLGSHHEINNALVGVRGNAQLLLMNPAGQQPGIREKLEVILRESGRIQEAARRLHELKTSLRGDAPHTRAA